jgi:uncharacterized phiE125 gp8 family phage protein
MNWTESNVASASSLIDLSLLRSYCRIIGTDDDGLLTMFAGAAINLIERDTRLAIRSRTFVGALDAHTRIAKLPRGPFLSLTSLVTIDADDDETTVDAASVKHDGGTPGEIMIPLIAPGHVSMRLTYRAGYLTLPDDIKLLIFSLVAHWYEHREAATSDAAPSEIPIGYRHMVRGLDPMQDGVR